MITFKSHLGLQVRPYLPGPFNSAISESSYSSNTSFFFADIPKYIQNRWARLSEINHLIFWVNLNLFTQWILTLIWVHVLVPIWKPSNHTNRWWVQRWRHRDIWIEFKDVRKASFNFSGCSCFCLLAWGLVGLWESLYHPHWLGLGTCRAWHLLDSFVMITFLTFLFLVLWSDQL